MIFQATVYCLETVAWNLQIQISLTTYGWQMNRHQVTLLADLPENQVNVDTWLSYVHLRRAAVHARSLVVPHVHMAVATSCQVISKQTAGRQTASLYNIAVGVQVDHQGAHQALSPTHTAPPPSGLCSPQEALCRGVLQQGTCTIKPFIHSFIHHVTPLSADRPSRAR